LKLAFLGELIFLQEELYQFQELCINVLIRAILERDNIG